LPHDPHPPPVEVPDPKLTRLATGRGPTRIPDFFDRVDDTLTCRECRLQQDLPTASSIVGELYECANCGLRSRIPALDSEAGMVSPPRPSAGAHTPND
jgi:hypothetical protein